MGSLHAIFRQTSEIKGLITSCIGDSTFSGMKAEYQRCINASAVLSGSLLSVVAMCGALRAKRSKIIFRATTEKFRSLMVT